MKNLINIYNDSIEDCDDIIKSLDENFLDMDFENCNLKLQMHTIKNEMIVLCNTAKTTMTETMDSL